MGRLEPQLGSLYVRGQVHQYIRTECRIISIEERGAPCSAPLAPSSMHFKCCLWETQVSGPSRNQLCQVCLRGFLMT